MPISSKILVELDKLKEDIKFKDLMKEILEEEDRGSGRYKETYDKIIQKYLIEDPDLMGDE